MSFEESTDVYCVNHPLLNSELLAEVCCHGVVAKEETISVPACALISSLLSVSNEGVWSRVWSELSQWMPFLEVCR